MKHRYFTFLPALAILLFPLTAYANWSWVWLTETTPLTILPFAVIGTLAIEMFTIIKFGKVQKRLHAALIIIAANLVSFVGGFFLGTINLDGYTITDMILHTPHYVISFIYLVLTLLVEFPVVYFSLWKNTDRRDRLLLSIIISNTVTTMLVSVCEGIFTAGGPWSM